MRGVVVALVDIRPFGADIGESFVLDRLGAKVRPGCLPINRTILVLTHFGDPPVRPFIALLMFSVDRETFLIDTGGKVCDEVRVSLFRDLDGSVLRVLELTGLWKERNPFRWNGEQSLDEESEATTAGAEVRDVGGNRDVGFFNLGEITECNLAFESSSVRHAVELLRTTLTHDHVINERLPAPVPRIALRIFVLLPKSGFDFTNHIGQA